MTWDVRQTRRFARAYKKLHDHVAADVDQAVGEIARNPDLGEKKKGDLSALWVYKVISGKEYPYIKPLQRPTDAGASRWPRLPRWSVGAKPTL